MKMKKLAAALCAAALSLTAVSFSAFAADTDGVAIDETNFPDKGFMRLMKEDYDTNGDNILSSDEIKKTTTIICGWSDIANVKGVEYFTELENFSCSANPITELDMSANKKLKTLDCYTLSLEKPLDLSENTSLEVLHCGRSGITELDVSNNKELYFLNCSYNDIAQLDISQNAKLKELDCILTDISELDISNNPYLLKAYTEGRKEEHTDNDTVNDIIEDTVYYIYDGDPDSDENEDYYDLRVDSATKIITETKADGVAIDETNFPDETFRQSVLDGLDKDKNGYLSTEEAAEATSMQCANEGITSLKGIEYLTELTSLTCSNNQLTELDISKNIALTHLYCGGNQLTELDVSKNTKLEVLTCFSNKIKELDVSSCTMLTHLNCYENQLTELDVSKNTKLVNLYCFGNQIKELNISNNTNLVIAYTKGEDVNDVPEGAYGKTYVETEEDEEGYTNYIYYNILMDKTTNIITEAAVEPEQKPETKPETKPTTGDTKPTDDSNKPTGSAAGIAFAGIALAGAALMVSKKRK